MAFLSHNFPKDQNKLNSQGFLSSFSAFSLVIRQQTLHFLRRAAIFEHLFLRNVPMFSDPESVNNKLPSFPSLSQNEASVSAITHWTTNQKLRKYFEKSTLCELEMWENFFGIPPLKEILESKQFRQLSTLWVNHYIGENKWNVSVNRNGTGAPFELIRLPKNYLDFFIASVFFHNCYF